ncbi:hypothetical protein M3Y97_00090700 [Aphelenchoides bicaudatus]|nr:hypothetical protein M3Y97_00090700 [Aphelenchoides bicaudatus]
MINWLSGTTSNSNCSSSYNESKELIREDRDESSAAHSNAPNSVYLQLNNVARRSNSKKLSVVPETDENNLTVTSISQVLFPASDRPVKYSNNKNTNQSEGAQRLAAHFEIHDEMMPDEVVVVDGTSNVGVEPLVVESNPPEFHEQGGLRYHYSLPAIHVT